MHRTLACVATACAMAAIAVLTPAPSVSVAAEEPHGSLVPRFDENFDQFPNGAGFDDGSVFGRWRVVFDGVEGGSGVRIDHHRLELDPAEVALPSQTHAALVVSRRTFAVRALLIRSAWTTMEQHRAVRPNPWEVGWLVWDYVDPDHFTYLALKATGWEIGRRDPSKPGGQRFIATGSTVLTPIGTRQTAVVDRVGTQTTIRVNDQLLASFEVGGDETSGAVGMYCEDSVVDWSRFSVATS